MPSPSWDNLSDFFQLEDFAVTATVTLRAGGSREVVGIYDDPYTGPSLEDDYRVESRSPMFRAKEVDLDGVSEGDTLSIGSESWYISAAPDATGQGTAVLHLRPRKA